MVTIFWLKNFSINGCKRKKIIWDNLDHFKNLWPVILKRQNKILSLRNGRILCQLIEKMRPSCFRVRGIRYNRTDNALISEYNCLQNIHWFLEVVRDDPYKIRYDYPRLRSNLIFTLHIKIKDFSIKMSHGFYVWLLNWKNN